MAANRLRKPTPQEIRLQEIKANKKSRPDPQTFRRRMALMCGGFIALYAGLFIIPVLIHFIRTKNEPVPEEIVEEAVIEDTVQNTENEIDIKSDKAVTESVATNLDAEELADVTTTVKAVEMDPEAEAIWQFLTGTMFTNNFTLIATQNDHTYLYLSEADDKFLLQIDDTQYIAVDNKIYTIDANGITPLKQNDEILYEGYTSLENILSLLKDCIIYSNHLQLDTTYTNRISGEEYKISVKLLKDTHPGLMFNIEGEDGITVATVSNIDNTYIDTSVVDEYLGKEKTEEKSDSKTDNKEKDKKTTKEQQTKDTGDTSDANTKQKNTENTDSKTQTEKTDNAEKSE